MAIITSEPSVRLNPIDTSNNSYALGAKAGSAAADTALQDTNASNQQNLRALLQGQAKAEDLKNAEATATNGRSVHVGDASIGVDPQAQLQSKMMNDQARQAKQLQDNWGEHSKSLQNNAEQIEAGLAGLNLGSVAGDKTAIASMVRLADGPTARIVAAQLSQIAPHSLQGDLQKTLNYFSGKSDTGVSQQERDTFRSLFAAAAKRVQSDYQSAADEFKTNAPLMAPLLAKNGQLDSYLNNFGSQGQKTFDRINEALKQTPSVQQASTTSPAPQPAGAPGLMSQAGSALMNFFKGSPQGGQPNSATAAPAPQQAQPQASDLPPAAAAYLKNLGQ